MDTEHISLFDSISQSALRKFIQDNTEEIKQPYYYNFTEKYIHIQYSFNEFESRDPNNVIKRTD